ncbi:hypothetical protein ACOSP7_031293 [Xanthoceras sorbifolium]|uniref:RING-type domain-containing protein n=1 Tax=Xanthoceras sorbifolium TaxID=99658 RepID=A0ABQ8H0Z3_9ROSI|nr:hypothetical protein JRO89_XS15G0039000 [Xanthoceras sorbifolium]
MAVEARHLNIFPPQLLGAREMIMNPIDTNNPSIYNNTQIGYGFPLSGTTTATDQSNLLPIYDSIHHQKQVIKSGSTLTYNNTNTNNNNSNISDLIPSRKRSRDSINPLLSYPSLQTQKNPTPFSFLGQDISLQIQQQQEDIDHLVSQHMDKVRMEIEERRKRQARRIMDAIEESVTKKLRAKEEEMEKIGKLNWALEERVKSLSIENQIWRELAQTNEATANALRTNLEQVLAATTVKDGVRNPGAGLDDEVIDDAQSCCGSSREAEEGRRTLAESEVEGTSRLCRSCRKEESCVLLLPCRHLCLCTVCGSSLHTCPVCKSPKTLSVHVNMS